MKFDPESSRLEISVRELCEDDIAFHRVGFERSQAWRRLALGGEAHRRTLAQRRDAFPGYLGEVALSADFDLVEFRARVTGRIDGAVETARGRWWIEEYKTCLFSANGGPLFPADREARARLQLAVYCLMWERLDRGSASGALVLIDPTARREESRDIAFDAGDTESEVRTRLRRLHAAAGQERRRLCRRAESAARVRFPFAEPRPVQTELIAGLSAALPDGGHVLAQAATGSGKTASALFAGLSAALAGGKTLAFLTAKTLQQSLVAETVAKMAPESCRVLWMRSKERMCANDRILCHEDHCSYARDYPAKMARSDILERLAAGGTVLHPDRVFAEARQDEVCPFEVQIELASRSDVFIGDYNYVFEPTAALRQFAPENLRETILIVDEAHNLPERARQIHSPEIREADVAAVENLAALSPEPAWAALAEALGHLRRFLADCAMTLETEDDRTIGEVSIDEEAFEEFFALWDPAMIAYFEWKRDTADVREDDPVVALHFSLVRFGLTLRFASGHSDFARLVERTDSGIRLGLVCLDPARALSGVLNAAASSVLMSATLEPFEMTRRLAGLSEARTSVVKLPPPFPRENRRIVVVPSVRTTYTARERNYGRIAELLARMADAHAGNELAIFPSYRFLREVAARLPPTRSRVVEQRADLSDFEKRRIFGLLDDPPEEGLLFLAVSGGMFAEGVDYPGERLSGVFVVSPSLPQVSFERELLRRYFDERDEAGFEFAYILPGMTRVVQAAGRLIRSEHDRGVIVLLCRRFLEEPYRRFLPEDWYEGEPEELVSRDPAESIRSFFARTE